MSRRAHRRQPDETESQSPPIYVLPPFTHTHRPSPPLSQTLLTSTNSHSNSPSRTPNPSGPISLVDISTILGSILSRTGPRYYKTCVASAGGIQPMKIVVRISGERTIRFNVAQEREVQFMRPGTYFYDPGCRSVPDEPRKKRRRTGTGKSKSVSSSSVGIVKTEPRRTLRWISNSTEKIEVFRNRQQHSDDEMSLDDDEEDEMMEEGGEPRVQIVICCCYAKTREKYGRRSVRYCNVEVGMMAQNALIQVEAINQIQMQIQDQRESSPLHLKLGAALVGQFDSDRAYENLRLGTRQIRSLLLEEWKRDFDASVMRNWKCSPVAVLTVGH